MAPPTLVQLRDQSQQRCYLEAAIDLRVKGQVVFPFPKLEVLPKLILHHDQQTQNLPWPAYFLFL